MIHKREFSSAILVLIFVLFFSSLLAQQNVDSTELLGEESITEKNGFLATFVRTPFVLFCFVGTISGVIFSAMIEFVVNLFSGFDAGYPNANIIWELGWEKIIDNWYWKPSVGWHVIISVIVWSPLLKSRKSKD